MVGKTVDLRVYFSEICLLAQNISSCQAQLEETNDIVSINIKVLSKIKFLQ